MSRILIACAGTALAALGGCGPLTVSATLFADRSKLSETTVERDQSAMGKVVVIDVRGLISDTSAGPLLGSSHNPVDELTAKLKKAEQDSSVRAVILRINSPGGTVTASDVMYREVRRFADRTGKPVVASLGEVAASGGYYLALSADRIVAEPTSITGSIGVIIPTLNLSEGLGKIGIRSRSVVSGGNKDVANPLEPARERHYELLQGIVDEFYAGFRARVAERRAPGRTGAGANAEAHDARSVDPARLDEIADGRILTGRQAEKEGLVDELGGVREAFDTAKRLAGLSGAQLVKYYREDTDLPRTAYAPTAASPAPGSVDVSLLRIRADMSSGLTGGESPGVYYLWLPPG